MKQRAFMVQIQAAVVEKVKASTAEVDQMKKDLIVREHRLDKLQKCHKGKRG